VLVAAALLAVACGGARPESASTTSAATTTEAPPSETTTSETRTAPEAAARSPWVGTFAAMSADQLHSRLVAREGAQGWTASLDSYALRVECDYTEVAGARTETTLRAHGSCRTVGDDEEVTSREVDTTLTLLPSGHVTGNFGTGQLDLAPAPPPSAPSGIQALAGQWYGTAVLADLEISAALRVENGALVGTADASFSDRVTCTIAERPSAREGGRVQVHVACTCEYEHAYDFERDCVLEPLGDVPGIASPDCFDDHVELMAPRDGEAPVID